MILNENQQANLNAYMNGKKYGISNYEDGVSEVVKELSELLINKQRDYGHKNITEMGVIGLIVRMNDKMARLKNLHGFTDKSYQLKEAKNESITDTWKDIANYAIIALMLENDTFKLELQEAKASPRG